VLEPIFEEDAVEARSLPNSTPFHRSQAAMVFPFALPVLVFRSSPFLAAWQDWLPEQGGSSVAKFPAFGRSVSLNFLKTPF
jgi:hypothetical protein